MRPPRSRRGTFVCSIVAFLACCAGACVAAPPLPALGVQPKVTVSGLSSGGYMAAQFAVAFSASVEGVGVVAGGTFDCAQGDPQRATTRCSCVYPSLCTTPTPSVLAFESAYRARGKAAVGQVDSLVNLKSQRVWLFSGGKDTTVRSANVEALRLFYVEKMKLPRRQMRYRHATASGHGLPVLPAPADAVSCGTSSYPFLIDCSIDAAGELLAWLLPGSVVPADPTDGQLLEFDQRPYLAGKGYTGLADTGYVFVPNACTAAGADCRVHVVFHGCRQARQSVNDAGEAVGDLFARESGYNRWAVGSGIVVLYPQVLPVDTGNPLIPYEYNPQACWDFWGYTQPFSRISRQVSNMAPQMLAVRAMIARLQR